MAEHRDYERSDVSVRVAVWSAVLLSVAVAAVAGALWLMKGQWEGQADRAPRPLPDVPAGQVEPPLQQRPDAEWADVRREFERLTGTAAWLDEDHTVARIPVEDAMDMLADRGWPEGAP